MLKERINYADVVARVKLLSVEPAVAHITEFNSPIYYHPAIKYTFESLEYLRGDAGDEIVAVAPYGSLWSKREREMIEFADILVADRDDQWEDRQAIIFIGDFEGELGQHALLNYKYEFVTLIGGRDYTIDSLDKSWLPAADPPGVTGASGEATDEMRFLLDAPVLGAVGASGRNTLIPKITLRELRAQVKAENEILEAGAALHGRTKYKYCLREKYRDERIAQSGKLEYISWHIDPIDSGLPSETRIGAPYFHNDSPSDIPGELIEGNDAYLFSHKPARFYTKRPIPNGEYRFYWDFWSSHWVDYTICGADTRPDELVKNTEVFVTVTAPDRTLHEAFFDPVDLDGGAVGAGSGQGILESDRFLFKTDTLIERIEWKDGEALMEFKSHRQPPDHHIDFIGLDGSVALRLDFDEARKEGAGAERTLVWGVCEQPWKEGDLLMIRMSESEPGLSGATNDGDCGDAPLPEPVTEPTVAPPGVSTTTRDAVE